MCHIICYRTVSNVYSVYNTLLTTWKKQAHVNYRIGRSWQKLWNSISINMKGKEVTNFYSIKNQRQNERLSIKRSITMSAWNCCASLWIKPSHTNKFVDCVGQWWLLLLVWEYRFISIKWIEEICKNDITCIIFIKTKKNI